MENQALWSRIEAFQFNDPMVVFSFTERLARENGWATGYARRVVEEYKRFLFMCCISPTSVTPSDAVDQAWHLHLTFTRSYWIDLCRETLAREIHHNPTKGGKAEAQKFNGFYNHTRAFYQSTFETEPPADIWPDNQARFSDVDFQRINLQTNWVLPRPTAQPDRWLIAALLLTMLGTVLSVTVQSLMPPFPISVQFLLLFMTGFVGGFWALRHMLIKTVEPAREVEKSKQARTGVVNRQTSNDGGEEGFILLAGDTAHSENADASDGGDGDSGCSGCSGCGGD